MKTLEELKNKLKDFKTTKFEVETYSEAEKGEGGMYFNNFQSAYNYFCRKVAEQNNEAFFDCDDFVKEESIQLNAYNEDDEVLNLDLWKRDI